jgi:hypothetical protein
VGGLRPLPIFTFNSSNNLAYKTFVTQEMLKKGYLASNSIYVCTEHSEEIINNYLNDLDGIFSKIKKCENDEENIMNLLENRICDAGFGRLN